MKYRSIVLTLSALFLMSIVSIPVYASTGNYSWNWVQCTGLTIKGNYEIQANVNSQWVVISWTVPTKSFENGIGCTAQRLENVQISGYVSSISYKPVNFQSVSAASSGSVTLESMVITCSRTGCSQPHPYPIPYGSNVVVSIYAIYGNSQYQAYPHSTQDTLKVTTQLQKGKKKGVACCLVCDSVLAFNSTLKKWYCPKRFCRAFPQWAVDSMESFEYLN